MVLTAFDERSYKALGVQLLQKWCTKAASLLGRNCVLTLSDGLWFTVVSQLPAFTLTSSTLRWSQSGDKQVRGAGSVTVPGMGQQV